MDNWQDSVLLFLRDDYRTTAQIIEGQPGTRNGSVICEHFRSSALTSGAIRLKTAFAQGACTDMDKKRIWAEARAVLLEQKQPQNLKTLNAMMKKAPRKESKEKANKRIRTWAQEAELLPEWDHLVSLCMELAEKSPGISVASRVWECKLDQEIAAHPKKNPHGFGKSSSKKLQATLDSVEAAYKKKCKAGKYTPWPDGVPNEDTFERLFNCAITAEAEQWLYNHGVSARGDTENVDSAPRSRNDLIALVGRCLKADTKLVTQLGIALQTHKPANKKPDGILAEQIADTDTLYQQMRNPKYNTVLVPIAFDDASGLGLFLFGQGLVPEINSFGTYEECDEIADALFGKGTRPSGPFYAIVYNYEIVAPGWLRAARSDDNNPELQPMKPIKPIAKSLWNQVVEVVEFEGRMDVPAATALEHFEACRNRAEADEAYRFNNGDAPRNCPSSFLRFFAEEDF